MQNAKPNKGSKILRLPRKTHLNTVAWASWGQEGVKRMGSYE